MITKQQFEHLHGVHGRDAMAAAEAELGRGLLTHEGGSTAASDLATGVDTMFLLFAGGMVFLMQLGFAMLCAGLIRHKNANNIMLKNILDAAVGSVVWYILGYGFAYGDAGSDPNAAHRRSNAFIGSHDFGLTHTADNNWIQAHPADGPAVGAGGNYVGYFFQWAFAATAATICSGSMAERVTFIAYLSYSIYMAGFVYPVIVHAVWSDVGWLSPWVGNGTKLTDNSQFFQGAWERGAAILNTGCIDFAGSGVVHMTGGVAGLVGTVMLGPRLGRFRDGKVSDSMTGSSTVLVVLGTLLLWFGWYGFNPGSQLAISTAQDAAVVGRAAVCTTLAAGAGGVTTMLFRYWRSGAFEVTFTCNGILAGLVGVTAGAHVLEPWAAIICGIGAGLTMYAAEAILLCLQIDDCVSAFPVHGAAGMYALIFVGFFAKHDFMTESYGYPRYARRYGWFYGGHGQVMLGNIVELVFITVWVSVNFFLLFGLLKLTGRLRVPPEVEHAGLDASVHGSKGGGAFVDMTIEAKKGAKDDAEAAMA